MAAGKGKPPPAKRSGKAAAKSTTRASKPARATSTKAAPRKRPAKKAPTGPTAADRRKAAEQISNVVPIKAAGAPSRRGREGTKQQRSGPDSPMSPEALRLTARREEALNLRRLGLTWQQAADRIRETYYAEVPRYTAADAYKDAKALLDSVTVEAVQGVREEDLAMLLAMQRRMFPAALDGDHKAVDRMLKILDQRAKYLGLYAPTKHELAGAGGGPVSLEMADPREVFEAAYAALDAALPQLERPSPDRP